MKLNRHYVLCAFFGILYAVLTVTIPMDTSTLVKYHLSVYQAHLIALSWVIPYIAIWFAAFYGYIQCRAYAQLIADSKDGHALKIISDGLMYLAIGLPVTAISGTTLNYLATRNPNLLPATTIFNNYLALAVVMLGFVTVNKGTSLLSHTIKKPPRTIWLRLATVGFVVFCIAYVYITLTNPARQFATVNSSRAAYYLPDFLLLTTIVIPYLLVWYWGVRSAYQIHLYEKHVRGVIYKGSLKLLAKGVAAVIAALMSLRVLVSLTTLLSNLTLKVLLVVLYGLLVVISAGYILIALGAKKMKRIEEV